MSENVLLVLNFLSIKFSLQSLFQGAKKPKRKWSTEEVKAIEKSLMDFIRMGKTPGKQDCERCIVAAPEALAERDWKGIKFYVYNRIISDQRL